MTFIALKEHFKKYALEGAPSADGMYLVQVRMVGIGLPSVFVANVWVTTQEPGELHIEAGPWEAFLKCNAIVRHLPLELRPLEHL